MTLEELQTEKENIKNEIKIKSCAHCGNKTKIVCEPLGHKYFVGWECSSCRSNITIVCIKKLIKYNIRKMAMQWNMRTETKNENVTFHKI